MSWHPNDLVADDDLLAYESTLEASFNRTEWDDKRSKALEDWLWPILRANGFAPERFRTRYEPDRVWGYTGSVYTDLTSAAKNDAADDLNLATIFASAGSDALLVGSTHKFRGVSLRILDAVSAVAGSMTVEYWADRWTPLAVANDTVRQGVLFARGGAIAWRVPADWVTRPVSTSPRLYFVRVTVSATPTSAKAGQLGVVRRSALCAPAAYRALTLIMREAKTGTEGPWREKAAEYEKEANAALERALQVVSGEFDSDSSDQVSQDETEQTRPEVAHGPFRMERG